MQHICPHCGAPLPEDAAFCPACARDVHTRKKARTPVPLRNKVLLAGLILILLAGGLGAAAWINRPYQPRSFEGDGEVLYTDETGSYQLVLAYNETPYNPVPLVEQPMEPSEEDTSRFPCRLFIHRTDSGETLKEEFLNRTESVTVQFLQDADSPSPMTCSDPAPDEASPDAALVTSLSFTGLSRQAVLEWRVTMKNGDTITLRQTISIIPIETHDYYPEDYPMDTVADLQALLAQVEAEVPSWDVVNLHLPPVAYQGDLALEQRPVNLYGWDGEDGRRTSWAGNIRLSVSYHTVPYIQNIDFVGTGDNVGMSAAARLFLRNCSFTGYKTGVLAYGNAFVNTRNCTFTGNTVAFHFNSEGNSVSSTMFTGNTFLNNTTALLLEQVPGGQELVFADCRFAGNGTDIDNRCDQPLDITQAIFE